MNYENFRVAEGKKLSLNKHDPAFTGEYQDKTQAVADLEKNIKRLAKLQDVLSAQNVYALLVIFQALDAAGKDSAIKHVMSGLNPQGCHVTSFKAPSPEELDHDYLWRAMKNSPERGRIGIFNRSYYEEVLVVRVHPEILERQQLPEKTRRDKNIWKNRFTEIRNFESYLENNGIHVLKFFLNVSKEEQKKRFLARIETPEKKLEIFRSRRQGAHLLRRLSEGLRGSTGSDEHQRFALVCDSRRQKMVYARSGFGNHCRKIRINGSALSASFPRANEKLAGSKKNTGK